MPTPIFASVTSHSRQTPIRRPGFILCLISFLSSFRAELCPALQQGVLTPEPHWEQSCEPWLLPPSTSAELFSAAGLKGCNPDPSEPGTEEPSLWGEWGFRLSPSHRSPGRLCVPPGCICMVHGRWFFASLWLQCYPSSSGSSIEEQGTARSSANLSLALPAVNH